MTRPYSNDLHERVVRAHLDGEPIRSVAARFGVSVSSVPKWVARYRATGSAGPDRWPPRLAPGAASRAGARAGGSDAAPDPRPAAGAAGERRHHGGRDTIWRFLRREGLRFKKTQFALEQYQCRMKTPR